MSEVTTSGETTVAPAETVSAPTAPVSSFGTSRGSGLARGKRASASAPAATKDASPADYKPTAIQVVNHQREYKNPFAPESTPSSETPAKVEPTVANVVVPAPASPAPAVVEAASKTAQPEPEVKAELKILPPEDKTPPAESWELNAQNQAAPQSSNRPAGRSEFRNDRRENRGEFRPRERREQSGEPRREQNTEPRREQRTFEPRPTPAVAEAKKSGFLAWLKGIFSSDSKVESQEVPNQHQENSGGENRRQDGNRGGRQHRRNRDFRGENRGPQYGSGQQAQSNEHGQGERRFDGHRGRRHHRGGRGRYRGEGRGGEHRSDSGPAS